MYGVFGKIVRSLRERGDAVGWESETVIIVVDACDFDMFTVGCNSVGGLCGHVDFIDGFTVFARYSGDGRQWCRTAEISVREPVDINGCCDRFFIVCGCFVVGDTKMRDGSTRYSRWIESVLSVNVTYADALSVMCGLTGPGFGVYNLIKGCSS